MKFEIVTIFPELINVLKMGVIGRAIIDEKITVNCWNPRDYADLPYRQVDDRPYGGGPGMVLMYEPIVQTLNAIKKKYPKETIRTIYLTPTGDQFNQQKIVNALQYNHLILICGRYEGIDQRIIDFHTDEQWSIGPYTLSGGEIPCCVIVDGIARQIQGVLGNEASAPEDSYYQDDFIDHPVYTRPQSIDGHDVPEVLLSGDHAKIASWRKKARSSLTKEDKSR